VSSTPTGTSPGAVVRPRRASPARRFPGDLNREAPASNSLLDHAAAAVAPSQTTSSPAIDQRTGTRASDTVRRACEPPRFHSPFDGNLSGTPLPPHHRRATVVVSPTRLPYLRVRPSRLPARVPVAVRVPELSRGIDYEVTSARRGSFVHETARSLPSPRSPHPPPRGAPAPRRRPGRRHRRRTGCARSQRRAHMAMDEPRAAPGGGCSWHRDRPPDPSPGRLDRFLTEDTTGCRSSRVWHHPSTEARFCLHRRSPAGRPSTARTPRTVARCAFRRCRRPSLSTWPAGGIYCGSSTTDPAGRPPPPASPRATHRRVAPACQLPVYAATRRRAVVSAPVDTPSARASLVRDTRGGFPRGPELVPLHARGRRPRRRGRSCRGASPNGHRQRRCPLPGPIRPHVDATLAQLPNPDPPERPAATRDR